MTRWIHWFEIPVSDMERAMHFYEYVFQIELTPYSPGNDLQMALFPERGDLGNGALCYHPEFYFPGQQGPILYLNADPVMGEVLTRIAEAGGTIVIPQSKISEDRGSMSLFIDTEGNRLALHSME